MINEQIVEQVCRFNYLGNDIDHGKNYDIGVKLDEFQTICDTIDRIFSNNVRRDIELKFYKAMAVPVLSYGCELWTTN